MEPHKEFQIPGIMTSVQNIELPQTSSFVTAHKSLMSVPQVSPMAQTLTFPHPTIVYAVPRHKADVFQSHLLLSARF